MQRSAAERCRRAPPRSVRGIPMPGIAQTSLCGCDVERRVPAPLLHAAAELHPGIRSADRHEGGSATLGVPVYNQQANLELSSGGSAFDFVNVTFILAARWVAAGLLTNLDEFTGDQNLTPAEWKQEDFVEGAQVPYRDAKGATYGYSWEGGAMVMGLSRMDLMEKKGLKIPKTFAELQQVCAEINGTDNVNGLVSFQLHHWSLPPYMQGFGGNIFRNPPSDIMPALNTPQAIQAVEYYANLLKNYAPQAA